MAPLVAGFGLWGVLSALGAIASWMLAAALLPERGVLERWQAAIVLGIALVLSAVQGLALVGRLERAPLAAAGAALFIGAIAWAAAIVRRREGPGGAGSRLRALATHDLLAPVRLVRACVAEREPLAFALVACAVPLAVSLAMIWLFRSWTWDPLWYHTAITNLAVQERSLGFVPTHDVRALGFVRNVELLSVWNVLLPRDRTLDDAAQLPFVALGCLAIAGWARRLGASRPAAAGLGACWLLAPPVFLQLHSTHVDIATGALLVTAWVWLTGPDFGRAERAMSIGAAALYAGTKFTGAFHGLFLAPIFLARAGLTARHRDRASTRLRPLAVEAAAAAAALLWLGGGAVYLHNLAAFGNPVWPVAVRLPILGELPGPVPADREWTRPFLASPGAPLRLVESWWVLPPLIWPDVRGGGFGPLFRWCSLWCIAAVALDAARGRDWRNGLAIVALFAVALAVPDAWWPRFTLGAAAAALAAVALVRERLGSASARRALGGAAAALAILGIVEGWPGYHPIGLLGRAARMSHAERATLQVEDWLWPQAAARLRETELRPGDAVAYDSSVYFLGELWARDLRNRAVFVEHPLDARRRARKSDGDLDAQYLERLRGERAVWAAVRPGGYADRALARAGATRLFVTPRYPSAVWRLPWAPGVGANR